MVVTVGASKLMLVVVGCVGKKEVVAASGPGVLEHGVVISDTEITGAARVSELRTPLVPTG